MVESDLQAATRERRYADLELAASSW
jgi:hypothetical protein